MRSTLTLFLAFGSVTGCSQPACTKQAARAGSLSICDLNDREVEPDACLTSLDCQMGTVCPPPDVEDESSPSSPRSCMVDPGGNFPRHRLQEGFDVDRFTIERTEGANGLISVSWTKPDQATLVRCALFACAPTFARCGGLRIENYDECVLAESSPTAAATGTFALDDDGIALVHAKCDADRVAAVPGLWAGCWAYDEISVVAATDLEHVAPTRVSPRLLPENLTLDCSTDFEGNGISSNTATPCWDSVDEAFGGCFAGVCRSRCRTDDDCAIGIPSGEGGGTETDTGSPTDEETCVVECGRPQLLGVCVPTTEANDPGLQPCPDDSCHCW